MEFDNVRMRRNETYAIAEITSDLQIRVNQVSVKFGDSVTEYVEIREYVPSTLSYTRGILLPLDAVPTVKEGLDIWQP